MFDFWNEYQHIVVSTKMKIILCGLFNCSWKRKKKWKSIASQLLMLFKTTFRFSFVLNVKFDSGTKEIHYLRSYENPELQNRTSTVFLTWMYVSVLHANCLLIINKSSWSLISDYDIKSGVCTFLRHVVECFFVRNDELHLSKILKQTR